MSKSTMQTRRLFDSVRQPEYTGENRCIPCTVVNVAIAAVLSGLVALASVPVAIAAFLLFAGVIFVRGYLVPGTPALTQQYFPDRVLRWFDKDPTEFGVRIKTGDDVDVETVLQDVGVLEEREDISDLALTKAFRDEWYAEMDRLDEDDAQRVLGELLGIDASRISVLPRSRSFEVKVDGDTSAKWESSDAFVVDMAAERVLKDWVDNWTDLTVERRSGIARGVRVYLERCPRCDGTVTLDEEMVKSCCRAHRVLASRCDDCGVRLFEIRASEVQQEGD
jgi:hypothetical protein